MSTSSSDNTSIPTASAASSSTTTTSSPMVTDDQVPAASGVKSGKVPTLKKVKGAKEDSKSKKRKRSNNDDEDNEDEGEDKAEDKEEDLKEPEENEGGENDEENSSGGAGGSSKKAKKGDKKKSSKAAGDSDDELVAKAATEKMNKLAKEGYRGKVDVEQEYSQADDAIWLREFQTLSSQVVLHPKGRLPRNDTKGRYYVNLGVYTKEMPPLPKLPVYPQLVKSEGGKWKLSSFSWNPTPVEGFMRNISICFEGRLSREIKGDSYGRIVATVELTDPEDVKGAFEFDQKIYKTFMDQLPYYDGMRKKPSKKDMASGKKHRKLAPLSSSSSADGSDRDERVEPDSKKTRPECVSECKFSPLLRIGNSKEDGSKLDTKEADYEEYVELYRSPVERWADSITGVVPAGNDSIQCAFIDSDGVTQLLPSDIKDGNRVRVCMQLGFSYTPKQAGCQKKWTIIQRVDQSVRPKMTRKSTDSVIPGLRKKKKGGFPPSSFSSITSDSNMSSSSSSSKSSVVEPTTAVGSTVSKPATNTTTAAVPVTMVAPDSADSTWASGYAAFLAKKQQQQTQQPAPLSAGADPATVASVDVAPPVEPSPAPLPLMAPLPLVAPVAAVMTTPAAMVVDLPVA